VFIKGRGEVSKIWNKPKRGGVKHKFVVESVNLRVQEVITGGVCSET